MALRFPGPAPWLVAALALFVACASQDVAKQTQRRSETRIRWEVEISDVQEIGPYRTATLTGKKGSWRLYFPRVGACESMVQPGATSVYRFDGPFGVLRAEQGPNCSPVGVGSLPAWRDEQPRRRSQFLMPREQARFRVIHRSESFLLIRGAFPLALEIRWPEPMDSVAVLPATPACLAQLDRTKATLEFRATGPDVFILESEAGPCPIVGLALPLEL
ncbi:MAG: hypothetical protein GY723_19515 [bacterium]|nr:hypothetical protein [bacterium]MCP5069351.1 hypothetical protein [bacterium]